MQQQKFDLDPTIVKLTISKCNNKNLNLDPTIVNLTIAKYKNKTEKLVPNYKCPQIILSFKYFKKIIIKKFYMAKPDDVEEVGPKTHHPNPSEAAICDMGTLVLELYHGAEPSTSSPQKPP